MSKKILVLAGALVLFAGEAFAGCTTYLYNGKKTRYTCTYTDGHYYTYYYDSQGRTSSYVYYDTTKTLTRKSDYSYDADGTQTITKYTSVESIASNTPDAKTENRYDENGHTTQTTQWSTPEAVANDAPDSKVAYGYDDAGHYTSYTYWNSAEAVANDAPDEKRLFTYDANGRQTSYTNYASPESVANNAPDYKYAATYDENGNQTSRTEWLSAESVANNAPDSKWAWQYNAEENIRMDEYYENSEDIANNTPTVRSFYMADVGNTVSYDKDGNLIGAGGDNMFIRDEQGRVVRMGSTWCEVLR